MTRPVSRETPPPPPEGAAALFGERLDVAVRYAELLADAGVTRGLLGPREVPRLWERHLVNCGLLADGLDPGESVCDVGSGAGLPGLVVGLLRPDLDITLLEPLLRRVTFLQEAIGLLGLEHVQVVRARAEELRDRRWDVVTSRAVAPLDRLASWCLPLCRPSGRMLAMKGDTAAEEIAAHVDTLRRLGARSWAVREFSTAAASMVAIEVVAGETGPSSARSGGRRAARRSGRRVSPRDGSDGRGRRGAQGRRTGGGSQDGRRGR